mmetsp:Transcript_19981/g.75452  ORF Transcript_19981/g.75452 Transcript_19981/m.75452 type:complete len:88 (-) Transcript_19981:16-279(-)|eukprot:scaffold7072_cov267-Pinguiococcus_pyrenoidosus.AAC.2
MPQTDPSGSYDYSVASAPHGPFTRFLRVWHAGEVQDHRVARACGRKLGEYSDLWWMRSGYVTGALQSTMFAFLTREGAALRDVQNAT